MQLLLTVQGCPLQIVRIACGGDSLYVLDSSGGAFAWGAGGAGELGIGALVPAAATPSRMVLANAMELVVGSAGGKFGAAVDQHGRLFTFGNGVCLALASNNPQASHTNQPPESACQLPKQIPPSACNSGLWLPCLHCQVAMSEDCLGLDGSSRALAKCLSTATQLSCTCQVVFVHPGPVITSMRGAHGLHTAGLVTHTHTPFFWPDHTVSVLVRQVGQGSWAKGVPGSAAWAAW